MVSQETGTHSRARDGCHVSIFSGRGVTILLVSELRFSKWFWVVLSLVDIGNPILLKLSYVSLIIEYSFLFVKWIHHHHDEDEADIEDVKLLKRLLRHLTILHHHPNLKDNQVFKSCLCHNQGFSHPWPLRRIWIFGTRKPMLRRKQGKCHTRLLPQQLLRNHLLSKGWSYLN